MIPIFYIKEQGQRGCCPFPLHPQIPADPASASLRTISLDDSEHLLHNHHTSVASLRLLFTFAPECRSPSLRNRCSPSPEYPPFEWLKFAVSVIGLLALVGYTTLAAFQLTEMRKATDASEQAAKAARDAVTQSRSNAHLDQRAWIGIGNITGEPALGQIWKIIVVFHNSGKTPARNLHGVSLPDPVKKGGSPNFSYTHDKHFSGGMIPPNGDFNATLIPTRSKSTGKPSPMTQPLLDSITTGDLSVYVHGRITYDDIYGCTHWLTSLLFHPS